MPTNSPIDFTLTPLERLVQIANSPVEQNLLNEEQTSLLNFHVFGGSENPAIPNAEIIVEHNRIPSNGLPAGVIPPDQPVEQKVIEYFRKEYNSEDVFEIGLVESASISMTDMLAGLKEQHGLDISVNDLTGTYTPQQGANLISFGSDSLLYGGSLTVFISTYEGPQA